jgi:hypothetical protein
MIKKSAPMKLGWPLLQYRDGGKVVTIGQVHPFNKDGHIKPGQCDYSLYGIPVKLDWSNDEIIRVLADSKEIAENILDHFGQRAEK